MLIWAVVLLTDGVGNAQTNSRQSAAFEPKPLAAPTVLALARTAGGKSGRVHDPYRGADIGNRRKGAVEDAGEHRGHLHHEEDGEGDADQEYGELGLVIDQKLESAAKDAAVLHGV